MTLLTNILNSGAHFQKDDKNKYRINFINLILLLAIPLFTVYAFLNFFKSLYAVSIIDGAIVVLLVVTFVYLRLTKNVYKASNIVLLMPLPIYFMMMTHNGGLYQSAFFWYFFYPIFAILLKGNGKGIRWIIPLITMIFVYYFYMVNQHIVQAYDPRLLLVLGVALILETLVVMYYEKVRKMFDKIIIKQNSELHDFKYDLEQKVAQELEKNRSLNDELVEIQKDIIFTMGSIGENRSHETGNHVKRVALYSKLFAEKMGLAKDVCLMIEQATPMHDIGKVAIPDAILNKPGKLTPEEFEYMKNHAVLGYEMLKGSKRTLLGIAASIAYEHHERWDGMGYPRGLSGTDISIYARIVALCDVFDALGSDRVYKKAWSDADILSYIEAERGRQFDPQIVDIFFDNLNAFFAIKLQYHEN